MIIWSGWGIVVILIGAVGLFVGVGAGGALEAWLPYGPAQSIGAIVGGMLAATGIYFFAQWRESSGEARVFIDEATGQRIEVRPSAGSLFFIPTRFWTWIVLALSAFFAITTFSATGPALAP
jgi:hypothetical protein